MARNHTLLLVSLAVLAGASSGIVAQRKSKSVLRLNAAQLGATPAILKPGKKPKASANGMRPVIMLTGYWPPTNEMLRKFSTNATQNPTGWIGSDWENRGYDVYSYFPEFPAGSYPRGRGDFEVDYQDTVADWARITSALKPRAIITFSNGGAQKNWEIEMNAQNHGRWVSDSLSPFQPNPSPPDGSLPVNTSRRSTLPARQMLAALAAANVDVNAWACFRRNGGSYLSEFIAYHGKWYKNMHSDRSQPDWCAAAGHIHVGPHSNAVLEQAVFVSLRELIAYVDRVEAGEEQHNFGYGHRGTAIQFMSGTPYPAGSQDLGVVGLLSNQPLVLMLSNQAQITPYNTGVYVTNPWTVLIPTMPSSTGTFSLTGIRSGGPGRIYSHFIYPDPQTQGGVGISNALEIDFK